MMLRNVIDAGEEQLIAVDERSQEIVAPLTDAAQAPAVHLVSKLGDQPELRTISGAILVAGVAFERP